MPEMTSDDTRISSAAIQLRAIASELEDYAWTLTIRDVGRALSQLAQHLREDAGRMEVMAMMVPAMEGLPPEKKAEIDGRLREHPRSGEERRMDGR